MLFRRKPKRKPVPVVVATMPARQAVCIKRYTCDRCKAISCAMRRKD